MIEVEEAEVGQRVRVTEYSDEYGDPKFLGKEGYVKELDYKHGCGSKDEPQVIVEFPNGQSDSFWLEELAVG